LRGRIRIRKKSYGSATLPFQELGARSKEPKAITLGSQGELRLGVWTRGWEPEVMILELGAMNYDLGASSQE